MALLEIANTDRIITITPGGGWTPGNPVYVQLLSPKVKANGKKIIVGTITWNMVGCIFLPNAFTGGSGSLSPTATKTKETTFNDFPIRKNDTGTCKGTFSFFGIPVPCTCSFQVTNAGQSKAKCN